LILQIAPSVEWVAAKGCRDGNCLRYGLLKSAEFMACPSDRNGTNPDCSLAPDLINNSWGNHGDIRESFFEDIVKAWREMNIVPLFANGNSGPSCGTANSPGNFANVLGVGATDRNDRLTEFSSRGPGADTNETTIGKLAFQQQNQDEGFLNGESKTSLFGWMKPDLCAPGSKLYSAGGRSDDHYLTMSGTSMATPVVSGVVALMIAELKKHNKNVDYFDAVYNSLTQTAYRDLPEPAGKGGKIFPPFPWRRDVCGFTNYTTYPNHFYGHGRVDAFKAIQLLRN
jgi:subtilisin family serine protease